jgi:L-seryl-tRNA(Ser) seleniumtransferase
VPHLRVTWDASAVGISANDVVKALKDGEPSIGTRNEGPALVIGVWMMRPGEEKIVARRLKQVLEQPARAKTAAAKG